MHKPGYPLRIIVSSIGSLTHMVASFIHGILKRSVPKPSSSILDGWTFVKQISGKEINSDSILVSLDVVSLFTNVPKELVMAAIEKRWRFISVNCKFSLDQFKYAVDLILGSTSFSFNGQFYDQIFGSPMGSPLSPILTDMVMEDLEVHCLGLLDFTVPVFYRYVDDVFTILPRDRLHDVLNVFNGYHPRLRFTYEIETNNMLSFLDATVIRDDNVLITNWYQKPTFSGRYVNFLSNHCVKHKIGIVKSLVDRALILSDVKFHESNIALVRGILIDNGYPPHFIDKHIKIRIREIRLRESDSNNDNKARASNCDNNKNYIKIPYVKNVSETLMKSM
ncbi:hypothetical protein DMN91_012325 [Ooceraea biroi]|uniref:Reverse transcriptase domain-containing protein n=1 Tax=Ooceraea biroi TaxID=2015173 RepID=A0A3L8D5A4_OOCBI|nr:uncharacterized protein LOC105278946 [Ooceraea biroi]RLU15331.1 hypothetical protein DMN91_012325 [Ooceraea biroi]